LPVTETDVINWDDNLSSDSSDEEQALLFLFVAISLDNYFSKFSKSLSTTFVTKI
jgi:hypothetical protein